MGVCVWGGGGGGGGGGEDLERIFMLGRVGEPLELLSIALLGSRISHK